MVPKVHLQVCAKYFVLRDQKVNQSSISLGKKYVDLWLPSIPIRAYVNLFILMLCFSYILATINKNEHSESHSTLFLQLT